MIRFILICFLAAPMLCQGQVDPKNKLRICGHRGGYYSSYPENSLSLFRYVAEQFGSDTVMLEIDLQKSKDGTLYILHDETLDRTTTGAGRIDQTTDKVLNQLSLKGGTGVEERIPTFQEVLQFARTENVLLMLDIKKDFYAEVLEAVKSERMTNRCLVLTFKWENSEKVAAMKSGVMLSCLITTVEDAHRLKALSLPAQQKAAYVNQKTPQEVITQLKAMGVLLLGDVSEHVRHQGKPLSSSEYQGIASKSQLDVLITDFPIEAKRGFR